MKKAPAMQVLFFNEIRSFGTSEIAFGSGILLRNVKCAPYVGERTSFHLMRSIKFHNGRRAIISHPKDISLRMGEYGMKITIDGLQAYLADRYSGWTNEQNMFMKLVEEIGEVAEVLNKRAGRKASNETDLK